MTRSEIEVAAPIVDWFVQNEWDVFTEVQPDRDGPIADIVAVKGSLSWIVEVKTSRSLTLLDQAIGWVGEANLVSVATPKPTRHPAFRRVTWDRVCDHLGIGYFTIDKHGAAAIGQVPRFNRKLLGTDGIRAVLRDEHRTWAEAGNSNGQRWTPFQGLVKALHKLAEESPGTKLSRFIEDTSHHYASDRGAVAVLKRHINDGVIPGLFVISGRVYPEGWNRHSVRVGEPTE